MNSSRFPPPPALARSARAASRLVLLAIVPALLVLFQVAPVRAANVLVGVEVLARSHARDLAGRRVGLITNPTGVDRELNSTIDIVRALPDVKLVRLFAPEHGVRGAHYAGDKVDETRDPVSGIPIASLYGKTRRPTPEMLADLDVVLYDIQDVGVRHYTFVSTLTYMMEACEKAGVEVWVLDRPEPMGGRVVGGPVLESDLKGFIGIHEVPVVYGLTPGEWARMIQAERTPGLKLRVIPLEGWRRGMNYGALDRPWVPPSQHIPHWETCYFYAMTGIIGEISDISVGVGYTLPFEAIGAPWIDGPALAKRLNALDLAGARFRPFAFVPRYGAFTGKPCNGVQIHVTDFERVDPQRIELALMEQIDALHPKQGLFRKALENKDCLFQAALGDRALARGLAAGESPAKHAPRLDAELARYLARRAKFLLYE